MLKYIISILLFIYGFSGYQTIIYADTNTDKINNHQQNWWFLQEDPRRVQKKGGLEVHIELVSILKFILGFLVTNIFINHLYIKSCGSYKVSPTPEMFVSCGVRCFGTTVVKLDCGLTFELSDDRRNCKCRRNAELKMDVIYTEKSLYFFYLHFSQQFGDDVSKLFFKFSIYNLLAVFGTNDEMIGAIPLCMRGSFGSVHWNKKVMM